MSSSGQDFRFIGNEHFDEIELWSEERLEDYQTCRINSLLTFVLKRSKFYGEKYRSMKMNTRSPITSLEDFQRMPIITKQDFIAAHAQGMEIFTGKHNVAFSTRGTSGQVLILPGDDQELEEYVRPAMRGYWWAGFRSGMRALLLAPAWHRLAACEVQGISRLGGQPVFFWGSLGYKYVHNFLKAVKDTRPEFISTTTPFLTSAWKSSKESGVDPKGIFEGVKRIMVVGAPLTLPLRKRLIEEFSCEDIFERAGTQEGAAADECRVHSAHHIHSDVCYLEVVGHEGEVLPPGTKGNLVVTKFVPTPNPIVRYMTGDIVKFLPEKCACGRIFPLLEFYDRPENTILIQGKRIGAYEVRTYVDEDETFCGTDFLILKDQEPHQTLEIMMQGEADSERTKNLQRKLEKLGVPVRVNWVRFLPLRPGLRQIVEKSSFHQ